MRKNGIKKIEHEVLSLITDITYASVSAWYAGTMRDLKMDLIVPKVREGHKKQPLFIWLCGGAFRVMDKSIWMPELLYFARKGYTVASVEYRTSNEVCFPDPLTDVKAAIRYLKAHADAFCIDTERICVAGESAGGSLASLAGMTGGCNEFEKGDYLEYDSRVQAVADFYGLVDLGIQVEGEPNDIIPPWTVTDYLGVNYTAEDVKRASAISYVTKEAVPVILLHGECDAAVPLEQSERFYEKLQENGVESELYLIEGAEHGDDAFYQEEVLAEIDSFLRKAWQGTSDSI